MRYIPPEELEAARQAEPVARYRAALLADGVLDADGVAAIEEQARSAVDEAFAAALAAAAPPTVGRPSSTSTRTHAGHRNDRPGRDRGSADRGPQHA